MSSLNDKFLNSRNIAIVRTDKIGDMVLTLPLCKAIKEYLPDSQISVIAKRYVEPLLKNQDILNGIYIEDYINGIDDIIKFNKFDIVFYPMPVFSECFAGFKYRIPLRVGSNYRFYSFLFNVKIKDHRKISLFHEAEYNVRMLNAITGQNHEVSLIKPYIDSKDIEFIKNKYLNKYIGKKIIVIHPGSGGSAKDLPINKIIELIKFYYIHKDIQIILTGIQSENKQCEYIFNECPNIINLCGKINLNQMIALIALCDMFIANSTGVLHIAAALDKQVLGFYPNTPHIGPQRWRPYSKKAIICTPPKSDNPILNDDMSRINMNNVYDKIIRSII